MSAAEESPSRPGLLVCVVGPSGAGKDSLIEAAQRRFGDDPRFAFPRRLISRSSQTGEPHEALTREAFEAARSRGAFLVSWAAHGELYAVPGEVRADLETGRVAVVNLSRAAIAEAHAVWPRLAVIKITAPRKILRARLEARGRETAAAIERRLSRPASISAPEGVAVLSIDNSGALADAEIAFIALLEKLAA